MKALVVGAGSMGGWFALFWKENLGEVLVTDIDKPKAKRVASKLGIGFADPSGAVPGVDVVLVAVPISATPKVVAELAPKLGRKTLLADLCSVKEEVVETMRGLNSKAELASLHPLFGPGAQTIYGKDILSVPVKPGRTYRKLVGDLSSLGARITELEAEEHDKLMSVIQCMTHYVLMGFISALESLKEFNRRGVRTPLYHALLNSAKAMLASDARLFGELQVYNKYSRIVRARLLETCKHLDTTLTAGNVRAIEESFEKLGGSFGFQEVKRAYQKLYDDFEVSG